MQAMPEPQAQMVSSQLRSAPFQPDKDMISVTTVQEPFGRGKGPFGGNTDDAADEGSNVEEQRVITIKGRKYLIYEGRIIDEREADKIYKLYHDLISSKKNAIEAQQRQA